jgi:hypothetical protein
MQKFSTKFVSIFLATILLTSQVMAGSNATTNSDSENYVDFDETEITNSFEEIDDLVNYIAANETATYSDIEQTNSIMLEGISATSAMTLWTEENAEPPIISAFWWGCLTGGIGILIVALTTDGDSVQIRKSVVGCAVPTGCSIISTLAYIIIVAAYGSSYYYW